MNERGLGRIRVQAEEAGAQSHAFAGEAEESHVIAAMGMWWAAWSVAPRTAALLMNRPGQGEDRGGPHGEPDQLSAVADAVLDAHGGRRPIGIETAVTTSGGHVCAGNDRWSAVDADAERARAVGSWRQFRRRAGGLSPGRREWCRRTAPPATTAAAAEGCTPAGRGEPASPRGMMRPSALRTTADFAIADNGRRGLGHHRTEGCGQNRQPGAAAIKPDIPGSLIPGVVRGWDAGHVADKGTARISEPHVGICCRRRSKLFADTVAAKSIRRFGAGRDEGLVQRRDRRRRPPLHEIDPRLHAQGQRRDREGGVKSRRGTPALAWRARSLRRAPPCCASTQPSSHLEMEGDFALANCLGKLKEREGQVGRMCSPSAGQHSTPGRQSSLASGRRRGCRCGAGVVMVLAKARQPGGSGSRPERTRARSECGRMAGRHEKPCAREVGD